jgi:hypothetical protein
MTTFYTPPGYTGQAELTAGNGLTVVDQGLWRFSQAGYNDRASFGLSLTVPSPTSGGLLYLRAENWPIAVVGNTLTAYDTGTVIYPASQCRITVTGQWVVIRQQNSNSFNGQGVLYNGTTETNLGTRTMNPNLLSYSTWPLVTYVIQGADVDGGAEDTFSTQIFEVRIRESASSKNSNKEFQSNTISRPVFAYTYSKSWQI